MRNLFDNPLLLIVLLLLIVVVFGAKRLPEAARSVGRSMRIFKAEVREMKDDDHGGGSTAEGSSRDRSIEGRVVDDRAEQGYRAGEGGRGDEPRRAGEPVEHPHRGDRPSGGA